jgi:cytochrome c1
VRVAREERHRRRDHDVGDRRQLLRSSLGLGDERCDHLGRRRQDQHAAEDHVDLVQTETEPRRHAEVAAAAADGPEQLGMRLGVHKQYIAVGGDELGRKQIVDRKPVLPDQEADAAAQGEASDPDRSGVAEPCREAVRSGSDRVLARRQPGLRRGGLALDVDVQTTHVREIEHDAALGDAVPGQAVAAAADGQLHLVLARERDDA